MAAHSQLKNRIKKIIRFALGTKPENMPALLKNADTVSFDIFDTLVKRDVPSPDSVHCLVEREFFSRTGRRVPDYYRKRKQAEASAYTRAHGREITLGDIFEEIKSIEDKDKKLLMNLEEEIECEICCANPDMKNIFALALKSRKRVVITSDMYLPEPVIRNILDKCGYFDYEKLYLSSAWGVTKASGQLYGHLLENEKNSSAAVIHIGDNIKSDFLRAGQAGLKPVLLHDHTNFLRFRPSEKQESFASACFRTFLNNHRPRGKDARDELAVSIGYEVLGPLLAGYCRWLKKQTEYCGVNKIFFLSREGRLLKQAYEELYPHRKETTAYLYVSRQALQIPMLSLCRNFHDMCARIKPLMREHTLKSIGEICHLGNEYEKRLASLRLKPEDDIFQIPEIVQDPYFLLVQELGEEYFTEQYKLTKAYLSQEGLYGSAILSDIGWHGTMQLALDEFCQNKVRLLGCYMGCWNPSSSKLYENLSRNGYLTAPGRNKEMELLLRFSCDIVETLLSNSEGSVMAYSTEEGKTVPVLQENELNADSREFILQIQKYAMAFLRDIKRSDVYSHANIPEELVFAGLRHLLRNPSRYTVNCFKNFRFLNGTLRSMLPEHSFFWYLAHPKILISDFEKSSCKLFFLKDVCKMPLPYFRLLKFFRENLKIKSSNQKIWLEQ